MLTVGMVTIKILAMYNQLLEPSKEITGNMPTNAGTEPRNYWQHVNKCWNRAKKLLATCQQMLEQSQKLLATCQHMLERSQEITGNMPTNAGTEP